MILYKLVGLVDACCLCDTVAKQTRLNQGMQHLTFEDLAALLELVRTNNQYNDEPEHSFWESLEARLVAECLPEFQP